MPQQADDPKEDLRRFSRTAGFPDGASHLVSNDIRERFGDSVVAHERESVFICNDVVISSESLSPLRNDQRTFSPKRGEHVRRTNQQVLSSRIDVGKVEPLHQSLNEPAARLCASFRLVFDSRLRP